VSDDDFLRVEASEQISVKTLVRCNAYGELRQLRTNQEMINPVNRGRPWTGADRLQPARPRSQQAENIPRACKGSSEADPSRIK
jgi:hypothetical protein